MGSGSEQRQAGSIICSNCGVDKCPAERIYSWGWTILSRIDISALKNRDFNGYFFTSYGKTQKETEINNRTNIKNCE